MFVMEAPVTRSEIENAPMKAKIRAGEMTVKQALEEHEPEKTVIGFTGGKDSTLTAWLVKRVCEENDIEKPRFMFVDHGQHFDEIEDYRPTRRQGAGRGAKRQKPGGGQPRRRRPG
jgi:3'-phosphoadenosine 5'-phosphosulfate sulfotransferase (PAPS reductase)/FAD synthetase